VPLNADAELCRPLQGLALKNIAILIREDEKCIYEDFGELLFTHFGLSGPVILSASAHIRRPDSAKYRIEIDLKPALDEKQLDARLLRDFAAAPNQNYANILPGLMPRSMAPVFSRVAQVPGECKVHSITKAQRVRTVQTLKCFPVSVQSLRSLREAVVTSGGVNVKEINPKTMESRLIAGLFFAGQVMDVDAYTGGFNLQIAWSTGYTAGMNV